jgi:predicted amidophosphoribosyltransferase
MHKIKEKTRGYNQTNIITESLSKKIGVPVLHIIEKYIDTESQTKKSIYQSWNNQEKNLNL